MTVVQKAISKSDPDVIVVNSRRPEVDEVHALSSTVLEKLAYAVGKNPATASKHDWFIATALTVRDRIVERWMDSTQQTYAAGGKRVYYLSLEFLIGRLLFDALNNLQMIDPMRKALAEFDVDLDQLRNVESDAALGNGGLGRLAACFMESMATLSLSAYGYGIRYDHGFFRQAIKDGWQQEYPEDWLSFGNPWEFERSEVQYVIGFGGNIEQAPRPNGKIKYTWNPKESVRAVAYDTPVVGWRGEHINTLRLWSSRAQNPLRLDAFNEGNYVEALSDRIRAESISKILYPSDSTTAGQELRLRQEYFFVSASLQDLVARHVRQFGSIGSLPDKVSIQLNDTHPAIAVAELMRILVDDYDLEWSTAWDLTRATFSYTNHTLLPEALESWPVPLMEHLLPRHMQIIYLINSVHLDKLREQGKHDHGLLASVSLIDEHAGRRVRMGHLAFLGSHKVNGVSAMHSNLMRSTVFKDLHQLFPDRITNKTNGITFRRWLFEANPGLTDLLREVAGERVLDDPDALLSLSGFAEDRAFHDKLRAVRRDNKVRLAKLIMERDGIAVDPDAMFDVHVKRIHEYKRQLLNILETIALYDAIRAQPTKDWTPRVKIFAGKAAPSYHRAKLIIKLAHSVADVVNNDPSVRGKLKVVFMPDYNVSLAEAIIPAADLSEQISTAGMEASGTGNMKFALNGALTIGTLDGANVEIRNHVGDENIYIFGLKANEVEDRRRVSLDARDVISRSPVLKDVLESLARGVYSNDDVDRFRPIVDDLTYRDYFMVAADFDSYFQTQRKLDALWQDQPKWQRASILNTANVGWFSSDRTIREYAEEIWKVPVRPAG